jgi:hypothetical protein
VEARERRQAVRDTVQGRKAARKQERDLLAQGVMPESLKEWKVGRCSMVPGAVFSDQIHIMIV